MRRATVFRLPCVLTSLLNQARISKGLRTFRTAAREHLRGVGSRVNAYGKQFSKQRSKTSANVASLADFPLVCIAPWMLLLSCLADSRTAYSSTRTT